MTRSNPETILHRVYAVVPALALRAGIQLDLFTRLSGNPMTARRLAKAIEMPEHRLSPLLYALVAGGLLTLADGVSSNTEETEPFLARG